MIEETIMAKRLKYKNDNHTFSQNLQSRYSMSVAEAELLVSEIKNLIKDTEYLNDGQEFFSAIDIDEPAGKPLKLCRTKRVKLTLRCPEDLEVRKKDGLKGFLSTAISRIAWQALEQGALLTQEDLAFLLNTSRANVKRIIASFKKQGDYIPTRGNYHDIGPGISHKYEAVRLYIKGVASSDIAMRLGHSLHAIERYISDFSLVVSASLEDYSSVAISRFTNISEKVVREYLILYDRYSLDPNLKPYLDSLIEDFSRQKLLKKNEKGV